MQALDAAIQQMLVQHVDAKATLWVAYSGGMDSHLLLHRVAYLAANTHRVRALHINHQLQAEAAQWVDHCQRQARALDVAFTAVNVAVDRQHPQGLEAAARAARYAAFEQHLGEGDSLLLAQHQDDQTETLLLQLFRGAGLAGLSSMPSLRPLGLGQIIRPWLDISHAALAEQAHALKLQWVDDPSNGDARFDRNFLRQLVLPQLRERWPGLDKAVARSRRHIAVAHTQLQVQAEQDLASVRLGGCLDSCALQALPCERALTVIRAWLSEQSVSAPSEAQLLRVWCEVLPARPDAQAQVNWCEGSLRGYRHRLYFVAPEPLIQEGVFHWPLAEAVLRLPDGRQLCLADFAPPGVRASETAQISVRFRVGGERLKPTGRSGHRSLKQLWQEADVPPWQRASTPLLYFDEQLVAVFGLAVAEGYAICP